MEILPLSKTMAPFVKEILYFDSGDHTGEHVIPFYADGFAGIVYSESEHPFTIQPQNKLLPDFYLYGQTIIPMSLKTQGVFKAYAVRLYPFAVRTLIGVDPKVLNDDCYDLMQVEGVDTSGTISKLKKAKSQSAIIEILSDYINLLLKNAASDPDHRVVLATNMILKANGNIKLDELRQQLYVTERTLERQFKKEMGVSALQFAKIIRFHSSMRIISDEDYLNLTDVSFKTGYADQSHFIRNFKKFTGKTPKEFERSISA